MSSLKVLPTRGRPRRFFASLASLAFAGIALLAAGSTGCVHAYDAPSPSQPHATLEIRRVYANARGEYLRETVKLDDHVALSAVDPLESAFVPRVDGVLARPTAAEVEVRAETFHRELQGSDEYVTEDVPYRETERFPCGSGGVPETCSRTVTKFRKETRLRTVPRMVDVTDGACAARQWIAPRANGNYLLEYDYRGSGICQVTCTERLPGETVASRPCPAPSPEEVERALAVR